VCEPDRTADLNQLEGKGQKGIVIIYTGVRLLEQFVRVGLVCVCVLPRACAHTRWCVGVLPRACAANERWCAGHGRKRGMSEGARETQTDTRPPGRRAANEFCDGCSSLSFSLHRPAVRRPSQIQAAHPRVCCVAQTYLVPASSLCFCCTSGAHLQRTAASLCHERLAMLFRSFSPKKFTTDV